MALLWLNRLCLLIYTQRKSHTRIMPSSPASNLPLQTTLSLFNGAHQTNCKLDWGQLFDLQPNLLPQSRTPSCSVSVNITSYYLLQLLMLFTLDAFPALLQFSVSHPSELTRRMWLAVKVDFLNYLNLHCLHSCIRRVFLTAFAGALHHFLALLTVNS